MRKLALPALVAIVAAFALPSIAAAQVDPTSDQYDPPKEKIMDLVASGDAGDPGDPSGDGTGDAQVGSLPFTGLDVVGLMAIAIAVAGLGLLLQRMTRGDGERLD